ncbi:MAG: exodeoxyribonuclease VII small subunit [Lachnospiraceae bacterium]|nr:exodeoxyribonuclease VII small subunit [Lachnospiraceae bacterium]
MDEKKNTTTENETNENESNERSLEELTGELEVIMGKLEEDGISLEDSFSYYSKGMELLKKCNEKIDKIEKEMITLDTEGFGITDEL